MRQPLPLLVMPMLFAAAAYFHLHNLHSQMGVNINSSYKAQTSFEFSIRERNNGNNSLPPRDHGHDNLRVASWNLRVPFPSDVEKNLSWVDRRDSIASAIAKWRPHLLAVQEDCYFMNDYLMSVQVQEQQTPASLRPRENMNTNMNNVKLSEIYNRYGLFNRNGQSNPTINWPENAFSPIVGRDGEHNSIWYDKTRFLAMKNVTFWLSRTPDEPGSSFDEVTGRVVNCAFLQDRLCTTAASTGNININTTQCPNYIFYCSAHLPSGNATRQLWSVDVLSNMFSQIHTDFVKEYNTQNILMMVSGDFNAAPGSETYTAMLNSRFVDSRQISQEGKPMEEYSSTAIDWQDGQGSLIDYIWTYNTEKQKQLQHKKGHPFPHNVVSVRHIEIPCCDSHYLSSGDDLLHNSNRMASDHLIVIADFAAT